MSEQKEIEEPDRSFFVGARFCMGKQKTIWRILDLDPENQTALVLADHEICRHPYHDYWTATSWKRCSLRQWLNEEYLHTEFSDQERHAILKTEIDNSDDLHPASDSSTRDFLFLLSVEEVCHYFKNDAERSTGHWWWLRSAGVNSRLAVDILDSGSINDYGTNICLDYGVRPAFTLNLKAEFSQSVLLF